MISAFRQFINKYGVDVIVTTRTVQMSGGEAVTDSKGHKVFDETEYETRCRIKLGGGSERIFNTAMMQSYDGKALFYLEDAEYINSDSKLRWEIDENETMYFLIKNPVRKKTHIEASLLSRDV